MLDKYVGIPFTNKGRDPKIGLDCFGLVWWVSRDCFGINIPSYADRYETSNGDDSAVAIAACRSFPWKQIPLADVRPGDVVELLICGKPWHVGIYAGGGYMLHTREHIGSIIESLDSLAWSRRINGFYRWTA